MPTFEQVESFFLNFEYRMKSQGIELFNEYNTPWLGLPTIDDRRNFEVEQQENPDDSENDYDDDVKTRRDPKEGP
tara:strand:+ start:504 stop:728 length:225 start_codon:yes stop_codon:yes gene_type:complete